jgi:hypothetical protein
VVFFKYGWQVSRCCSLKTENGRHCSKQEMSVTLFDTTARQTTYTW